MDEYEESIKDHIDNMSVSVDSHLYIITEYLRSNSSKALITQEISEKISSTNQIIQRTCNKNIEKIGTNLQNLLDYNEDIKGIANHIENSGSITQQHLIKLSGIKQKIAENRIKLKNLDDLKQMLDLCLPALRTYDIIKQDLANKNHISCIDGIVKLENEYLPHVTTYSFSKKILTSIIDLKSKLKTNVINDIKSFLIETKSNHQIIGDYTSSKLSEFDSKQRKIIDIDISPYLDISDIHAANYVFKSLSCHQEVINFYRSHRKKQIILLTNWQPKGKVDQNSLRDFFSNIIGFFIIEDQVFQMVDGLIDSSYLKVLWEDSCNHLGTIIEKILSENFSKNFAILMKNHLKNLMMLMLAFTFDEEPLNRIIDGIYKVYRTQMLIEYSKILSTTFMSETFDKIEIRNYSEFKYKNLMSKPVLYPLRVKFSTFAYSLTEVFMSLLRNLCEYIQDIYTNRGEVHELLLEALKLFIVDYLPDSIPKAKVDRISISLMIQLIVDLVHVSESLPRLLKAVKKLVKNFHFVIKTDYNENDLMNPILGNVIDIFCQKLSNQILKIFDECKIATPSQNDYLMISRITQIIQEILKSFSSFQSQKKVFIINHVYNKLSNTLLLALKTELDSRNINYNIFPAYNTLINNLNQMIEMESFEVQKSFSTQTKTISMIISALLSWNWDPIIDNYLPNSTRLDELNADHINLLKTILIKLDPLSIPKEINESVRNKNAVQHALSILNNLN